MYMCNEYNILQDLKFWKCWKSINLGAQVLLNGHGFLNLQSLTYCILGQRLMARKVVCFSATLLENSYSSDIDTLLRKNVHKALMLTILWNNMNDAIVQLMNTMGSNEDAHFWETNKGMQVKTYR